MTQFRNKIVELKKEISKVLVGQEEMIDLILTALLAGGHILIEGVPGVAKTLSAKLISKVLDVKYQRIQFTPDLMPSDVLGTSIYNPKSGEFDFKKGPVFSNLLLIDEINRAPAKTQAALFEVMEEKQITIDGLKFILPPPFIVLATQNPVEHEGTYRLPEAQLDRFLFKISVEYPSFENEIEILKNKTKLKYDETLSIINKVLTSEDLEEFSSLINDVVVDDVLFDYIAKIIQLSRKFHSVYLGASPRAGILLLKASQAYAILNGRDFITPEDVQYLSIPLLRHRIILMPEKEMEGISTDEVIKEILHEVEVPR